MSGMMASRGGAVLASLLAVAILAVACSSGSDDPADASPATDEAPAEATSDPEAEFGTDATTQSPTAEPIRDVLPAAQNVYLSRDPFDPVREPVVEAVADAGDETKEPGVPGGAEDPDDEAKPIQTDGTACRAQGEAVCDGIVVSLLDITEQAAHPTAIVQVDGIVSSVTEGQVFATYFRARSIGESCADFEYGDEPFQLCVGGHTLK